MALRRALGLTKRQGNGFDGDSDDDGDYDGYGWWWSPTGIAVRYSIVLVLLAALLLYFVGGYWHARQRVARGLAPLPYHRWMMRSFYRRPPHLPPPPGHGYGYAAGAPPGPEAYDMGHYPPPPPPPPPAYNHNEAPPPVYRPPEGASKVLADQNFHHLGDTHRAGEGSASRSAR